MERNTELRSSKILAPLREGCWVIQQTNDRTVRLLKYTTDRVAPPDNFLTIDKPQRDYYNERQHNVRLSIWLPPLRDVTEIIVVQRTSINNYSIMHSTSTDYRVIPATTLAAVNSALQAIYTGGLVQAQSSVTAQPKNAPADDIDDDDDCDDDCDEVD